MRLMDEWKKVQIELAPAIQPKNPECDVAQERMEKCFADICKGHAIPVPFASRYPNIKGTSYQGKKK